MQLGGIEMKGEEVLEVVVGEEEVRDARGFGRVQVGAILMVAVIEIEVGPDLDG